jgi:hypothetical protein
VRQRDRAPVGVLAHRAGVAGLDYVARVRGVTLAEDDLMGAEAARDSHLCDALEVGRSERLEDWDAAQQANGVLRRAHA